MLLKKFEAVKGFLVQNRGAEKGENLTSYGDYKKPVS